MSSLLCKVFRFVLQIFSMIVSFVAEAITTLGDAVIDVLDDLLDSVGDTLGGIFGGSPVLWGVLAIGVAYILFGGSSEDKTEVGGVVDYVR